MLKRESAATRAARKLGQLGKGASKRRGDAAYYAALQRAAVAKRLAKRAQQGADLG